MRAGDSLKTVRAGFACESDLAQLKSWRNLELCSDSPHARDAIEFARLASKWWRYYNRQNASVHSLKELKHRTTSEPSREVAFMVLARADWNRTAPILGLCCCRRTWCNHIVLEFAAVHPVVLDDARA